MPNPFATTALPATGIAPAVSPEVAAARNALAVAEGTVSPTDNQVTFIAKLLGERDWQSGGAKYVRRTAALNVAIGYALAPMDPNTPPSISRLLNNSVGRISDYGVRVNVILASLALNTDLPDSDRRGLYAQLTKAGASHLIDLLLALPVRFIPQDDIDANVAVALGTQTLVTTVDVPAGRYAVETNEGAVNTLAFYKVDRPTEGRWAGYVFVKHIVSDGEQRLSQAAGKAILAKITEVGAEVASARYGHEIGECGVCGRTLTNDESRARGIGPVCAAKSGW